MLSVSSSNVYLAKDSLQPYPDLITFYMCRSDIVKTKGFPVTHYVTFGVQYSLLCLCSECPTGLSETMVCDEENLVYFKVRRMRRKI